MKLIYDARPIANPHTGLGRYTGSLLLALLGTYTNRDLRVHVLLPGEDGLRGNGFFQALQPFLQAGCCQAQFVALDAVTLTQQLRLPGLVNRLDADLYFYPHFDLPLAVSIPSIFVVHDLLPILVARYVQRFAPAKKAYFTLMLRLAIRRAGRSRRVPGRGWGWPWFPGRGSTRCASGAGRGRSPGAPPSGGKRAGHTGRYPLRKLRGFRSRAGQRRGGRPE